MSKTSSKAIAALLLETGAVTLSPSKPFIWASGIRSPVYCDNRLLLSYPKFRDRVREGFKEIAAKISFDAVAGIATGGIPHAAILADHWEKPMLYVRPSPKEHGKGNQIEGRLAKGDQILVIEDLVSTGQSSLGAIKALRDTGGVVRHCLAIFTYGLASAKEAFKEADCELKTLTDLETLLEVALEQKILTNEEARLIEKFSLDLKGPKGWGSQPQKRRIGRP